MGGDRARARALYLGLIVRDPSDMDARIGLARVDAWDGCWALAARGYRSVLSAQAGAIEARAGLVDILLWERRWKEAEQELADGLALAPSAPELLARRAKLAHWRGDDRLALSDIDAAIRGAPQDPMLRAQRDEIFLGEARLTQRLLLLPPKYDDVFTGEAELMQRYKRMRFTLGHRFVMRTGAAADVTTTDGRRAVGAYYQSMTGAWAGLEVAHTSPAIALPRWAFTLTALVPFGSRFSLYASASVWSYRTDKTVYIFAPMVNMSVTDTVDVGARTWISNVVTTSPNQPTDSETVFSFGVRAIWRPETRSLIGTEYTYGVDLDQNPTVAQLIELRSHGWTVFFRRMFTREIGVQPVAALEIRENLRNHAVFLLPAFELSLIARW